MHQQNNPEQTPWLSSLRSLTEFLNQTISYLTSLNKGFFKHLQLEKYPIDSYTAVWQKFSSIIHQRISNYMANPQQEVLISSAINWVIPEWAKSIIQIHQFTKRYCQGQEGQSITLEKFEVAAQQLKLRERWKIGEQNTVIQALQIPLYFLEDLLTKGLQLTTSLDERYEQLQSCISQTNHNSFFQKLSVIKIQSKMLQNSLHQLYSITSSKQWIVSGQDLSVVRLDLVIQQYELVQNDRKRLLLKFMQRLKLVRRWRGLQKKRIQRLQERKKNILLLIKGEQNYLLGLTEYITKIKQPIERLGILDTNKLRKLFSSIVEIHCFHQSILEMLKSHFDKYHDTQCYAPILKKIIPFFKIYTDYILNAESAQLLMKELIKKSPPISEICRQYTLQTNKLAENELLQPTFRIARYQALFQEIIKKTSTSHPDYKQFLEVQTIFKNVLTQVNNEVDRIIRRMKLNDLDREYATPELPIYSEGRQYLNEFPLTLIRQPYPLQVNLIVCSDLLLIVEQPSRKLQKIIPVNDQFFARRQENNKIYRNMVTIHSDGFITFTVGLDDIYANRAEEIYQLLRSITKQSGQLVKISVLGTQEIGSTSFAKYTEYIVEVKYLDIKKLLHVRFSLIADMVIQMQRYYKDSLKINESEVLRKSWFNSHKTKVIQGRKMIIGQIFQKLFNHQLIKQNPKHFLSYLNLPENFYDVARVSYDRRISAAQTVTLSRLKRSYLTKKQERQSLTILCGTEIKLGRDLFHDIENQQEFRKMKEDLPKIQIQIITLGEQEPIIVRITEYDTVEDVCNRISKLIGLRSNRDFRLFHQIGKKELRVLEHEQIITKIFDFKEGRGSQGGFYEMVKKTFRSFIFPQDYPILIFKKYYYLPYDIEMAEMRRDLIRLNLMVHQVFAQIKQAKYQLIFDQYLLFLAMLIYITVEGRIDNAKNIDPDIVHRIIPDAIFKLKNLAQQEWLEKSSRHITRLHEEILKVKQFNQHQYREGKIKADTVSKHNLYFGLKFLCSQIVLNKIKTNSLFGSNLFYVQPHNNCYKKLQQKNLKVSYNMWLAVNFESIKLLSPSSKESIMELKYEDIGKPEVYCEAIVFKTLSVIEQEYRFNTYQSFQISQLVKYNKALSDILVNLKDDKQLNARVKEYRDQLIQYRSTFADQNGFNNQ